jgi:hypothetical protein
MTVHHTQWGPWVGHDGKGMPVPAGTIVEVFSDEDPRNPRNGPVCRVGIAGVDLLSSWHWTPQTRSTQVSLPIDRYRVKRPKGLGVLLSAMPNARVLEDA